MLEVLLVDDEPSIRETIRDALQDEGYSVDTANDGAEALARVTEKRFDLVISDVRLPKLDGLSLFRRLRQDFPSTRVIIMTAYGTVQEAVEAMKEHALDYITKPFDLDHLLHLVARIAEQKHLESELALAHRQLAALGAKATLIGQSPLMVELKERIEMVAQSDCSVLITGESGTGKDLIARTIHERSARRDRPYVVVNCASFPETLLEAELFGYEKGAFTGAHKKREGHFETANGGTLFLDEIGEMSPAGQAKLLRVLQDGSFQRIGSDTPVHVDVRILSATNRDLGQLTAAGHFREDLLFRLNVIHIEVPPLRARRGDLPALVAHSVERLGKGSDLQTRAISPRAWAALNEYSFPGNVRELDHSVQHAVIMSRGAEIDLEHLPASLRGSAVPAAATSTGVRALSHAVREFEHEYLRRVLEATGGRKTRAAELLGISRKTLWEKLRSSIDAEREEEDQESPAR